MGMRISYEWDPPEGYPEESRRVGTPQPRLIQQLIGIVRTLINIIESILNI